MLSSQSGVSEAPNPGWSGTITSKRSHREEKKIGKVPDVTEPVRRVGGAEPRMVGHYHVEALRQPLHERHPGRDAERAMQVEQRRALTPAHDPDLAAVEGLEGLPVAHYLSGVIPERA